MEKPRCYQHQSRRRWPDQLIRKAAAVYLACAVISSGHAPAYLGGKPQQQMLSQSFRHGYIAIRHKLISDLVNACFGAGFIFFASWCTRNTCSSDDFIFELDRQGSSICNNTV